MGDHRSFDAPQIEDEHIRWACRTLGLPEHAFHGSDGADPRQGALKSMESIDIAACPGSGKTTLLVAKVAILAEGWRDTSRGICVLSHTNVARREIQSRLGNIDAGRRLLSYPHFIGTIHSFVNQFLSLPWLRSRGFPVKVIDNDVCRRRRWNALPDWVRNGLEKNRHEPSVLTIEAPDFSVGRVRWGRGNLKCESKTYQQMRRVCQRSAQDGYFCHDEMFVWARELLDKAPMVPAMLRERFVMLLVDEAQDNSEVQSSILRRVFRDGAGGVVRQRFGDADQAIFSFAGGVAATTDPFPDVTAKTEMPNSFRFGQRIAELATPLSADALELQGLGPRTPSSHNVADLRNTIFVFNEKSASRVLDAYAELLLGSFSDEELRNGTFTAVGQTHKPSEKEDPTHFPRHIGHYWPEYDAEGMGRAGNYKTFVGHLHSGQRDAMLAQATHPATEQIARGVLKLVQTTGTVSARGTECHGHVIDLLADKAEHGVVYAALVHEFAVLRKPMTKEAWNERWRSAVWELANVIAGVPLCEEEAEAFLRWEDRGGRDTSTAAAGTNVYHYPEERPKVQIRVGSVHSVKGETHTATLVLETFWFQHNLEALAEWIGGSKRGWTKKDGKRQRSRLRVHYVAMTRPSHLLCLAMKRSTFEALGNDDVAVELEERGWRVKHL